MSDEQRWGIHWFRRDLRVRGNPALEWSVREHQGRVLGIFSFDPAFLGRADFSVNRFGFFLEALAALQSDLRAHGGDLLVLDASPAQSFDALLTRLKDAKVALPSTWSWNRDYEPFSIRRDAQIESLLFDSHGIVTHTDRDHLLIEPRELYKNETPGSFYQVFTPFRKTWLRLLATDEMQERLAFQKEALKRPLRFSLRWPAVLGRQPEDTLAEYRKRIGAQLTVRLPKAGSGAAQDTLKVFKAEALSDYDHQRDIPSVEGTSHFSVYLKNGSLTVAQAIVQLELADGGDSKFLSELVWREFYYHVLAHLPRVESTPFNRGYQNIEWENRPDHFEAWKEGRTGFPIVDAGMRQLRETGWMHNRVRMITASFLCKDLLVNWQWGENHFMKLLLDGDLAPNNGGWQWAASTGCDPQPYFRIFNPALQGQRFDPEGAYVRRWVPELSKVPAQDIHEPWKRNAAAGTGYPKPIVEHAVQSRRAVALYRAARSAPP